MARFGEADFETVFRTLDLTQGQVLRALLSSERIPAVLLDEHTIQTQQLWAPAMGGVRIRVPTEYAEQAKRIIAEFQAGTFELPEDDLPPAPARP
jgi:hypothetical protein